MNKQLKRLGLLVTAAMIGAAGHVFAADILNVSVNGSRYMEDSGITRLAVGNPDIADIRLLSNNDYLVVGKKAGSTSLLVWSDHGRQEYNVYVSGDDEGTEKAIQKLSKSESYMKKSLKKLRKTPTITLIWMRSSIS